MQTWQGSNDGYVHWVRDIQQDASQELPKLIWNAGILSKRHKIDQCNYTKDYWVLATFLDAVVH